MMESNTTFCYFDSDSDTSDTSYTHSGPLFVPDNELSDMTKVTDCDAETDEKVKFHQITHQIIIIILSLNRI